MQTRMQRLSPTSVSLWRHNPYDRFIREVPSLRRGDFFCIAVGGVGVVCGKGVLQRYRQFANKTVDWGTRGGIFLYLYIILHYGLLCALVYDGAACFCRWRPADGQSAIRHCFSRPLRGAFLWQIGEMCLVRDAGPVP